MSIIAQRRQKLQKFRFGLDAILNLISLKTPVYAKKLVRRHRYRCDVAPWSKFFCRLVDGKSNFFEANTLGDKMNLVKLLDLGDISAQGEVLKQPEITIRVSEFALLAKT